MSLTWHLVRSALAVLITADQLKHEDLSQSHVSGIHTVQCTRERKRFPMAEWTWSEVWQANHSVRIEICKSQTWFPSAGEQAYLTRSSRCALLGQRHTPFYSGIIHQCEGWCRIGSFHSICTESKTDIIGCHRSQAWRISERVWQASRKCIETPVRLCSNSTGHANARSSTFQGRVKGKNVAALTPRCLSRGNRPLNKLSYHEIGASESTSDLSYQSFLIYWQTSGWFNHTCTIVSSWKISL